MGRIVVKEGNPFQQKIYNTFLFIFSVIMGRIVVREGKKFFHRSVGKQGERQGENKIRNTRQK